MLVLFSLVLEAGQGTRAQCPPLSGPVPGTRLLSGDVNREHLHRAVSAAFPVEPASPPFHAAHCGEAGAAAQLLPEETEDGGWKVLGDSCRGGAGYPRHLRCFSRNACLLPVRVQALTSPRTAAGPSSPSLRPAAWPSPAWEAALAPEPGSSARDPACLS